jgi:hypothetical protein
VEKLDPADSHCCARSVPDSSVSLADEEVLRPHPPRASPDLPWPALPSEHLDLRFHLSNRHNQQETNNSHEWKRVEVCIPIPRLRSQPTPEAPTAALPSTIHEPILLAHVCSKALMRKFCADKTSPKAIYGHLAGPGLLVNHCSSSLPAGSPGCPCLVTTGCVMVPPLSCLTTTLCHVDGLESFPGHALWRWRRGFAPSLVVHLSI